jgi:hypothetical protein
MAVRILRLYRCMVDRIENYYNARVLDQLPRRPRGLFQSSAKGAQECRFVGDRQQEIAESLPGQEVRQMHKRPFGTMAAIRRITPAPRAESVEADDKVVLFKSASYRLQ